MCSSSASSTVYWCVASTLKASRIFCSNRKTSIYVWVYLFAIYIHILIWSNEEDLLSKLDWRLCVQKPWSNSKPCSCTALDAKSKEINKAYVGIHVSILNFSHGHDDVIKWKHFPRNCPFVRGVHRSPVKSPHKGQWRGALVFSLICVWINDWVNNREAGDLRRYRAHYYVIVMELWLSV